MTKIIQIDYKKEEETGTIDESSVLRHVAKDVSQKEFGSTELKKVLDDMKEAMDREDDSVAIAAPQIGISKRIFIVHERSYDKDAKWKPLVFINPIIVKASKKVALRDGEGCLSVRPLFGSSWRHVSVTVEARDLNGHKFSFGATGLIAHIFQHEIDHLDGILFIDHGVDVRELTKEEKEKK